MNQPDIDLLAEARRIKSGDNVIPHNAPRLLLVRVEALEMAIKRVFSELKTLMGEGGSPCPPPTSTDDFYVIETAKVVGMNYRQIQTILNSYPNYPQLLQWFVDKDGVLVMTFERKG